jgi:hypothetical protein
MYISELIFVGHGEVDIGVHENFEELILGNAGLLHLLE